MGCPAELTKEKLQQLGIIKVTKRGRIFTSNCELRQQVMTKTTRYDKQQYKYVTLYDKQLHEKQKKENKNALGLRPILVHRIVYAWFHGVAPANMDVDHKNDNSLDNRLRNLQLLSRAENLAKRKGHMNQWDKSLKK